MEIPSSHAGVVKELKVEVGDKVNEGSADPALEGEAAAVRPRPAAPAAAAALLRPPPRRRRAPAPPAAAAPATGARPRRPRPPASVGGDLELRPARARRRPGRLLGGVPRRRPRHEGRAGRALRDARRRLPERRLHPVEGDAARRRGDRRGRALRRRRRRASARRRSIAPSCVAHKNKVVGKLTGGLAQMAKMRKVTVVTRQRPLHRRQPRRRRRSRAAAARQTIGFTRAIIAAGSRGGEAAVPAEGRSAHRRPRPARSSCASGRSGC